MSKSISKSVPSHFQSSQAQVKTSKKLSSALRHQAENMRLSISTDGYVSVQELLRHSQFKGVSFQQIEECVSKCPKQRFQLKRSSDGVMFIRATQGHSISSVKDDELFELIEDPASIPVCLHGTYAQHIASIQKTGLNRMRRNNIHLIACLPSEEDGVVSGMRKSADTIVTIDVARAMAAGIPFFRSSNGVILSPGLGDTGCIPAEFISQILGRGRPGYNTRSHNTKQQATVEQQQPQHRPEESPLPCAQSVFTCDVDVNVQKESSLSFSCRTSAFTHYCVIDFEATCVDKKVIHPQEIIEFPAVMVSAESLKVVTEFHSYVRPLHHPVLSDFCTALTGITQDTVNRAPDFTTVFERFQTFLENFEARYRDEHEGQEPRVLFASHGDWDFLTMLPNQCKTSHIPVPLPLTCWMNVKVLYTSSLSCRVRDKDSRGDKKTKVKGLGMAAMLEQLGLQLVGRHHSGIDDTRNIARIVIELITTRGAVPKITSELYKHLSSTTRNSSGNGNTHFSKSERSSSQTQQNKKKNIKYSFT